MRVEVYDVDNQAFWGQTFASVEEAKAYILQSGRPLDPNDCFTFYEKVGELVGENYL